jgi:hypothetical protein
MLDTMVGRFQEAMGRSALATYLESSAPITWTNQRPSAKLQLAFWELVCEDDPRSVLALPSLEQREVRRLCALEDFLPDCFLEPLPEAAPVHGLEVIRQPSPSPPPVDDLRGATARTAAWVDRTLSPSGLRFCPYTASSTLSASGLEAYGVDSAPIDYAHCGGASLPELLRSFWTAVAAMLEAGESGTSSIILSAPAWDDRWDEWCHVVFPLLEAAVLAAGLGREIGIVCFHPEYVTPSTEWLARHRFGHMYSPQKLRTYVEEHDSELAARTSDAELLWAGSYQRRSPHAAINVLWARQLEQAEQKRKSSMLYTRNVRVVLSAGRDALERARQEERER